MHRDCLEQKRKKGLLPVLLTGNPSEVRITASEYLTNSGTIQHFQADLRKQPHKVSLWLRLWPASFNSPLVCADDCCFYISNRMLLGYAHASFQSCPWGPSPGTAVKNLSVLHAVVLVMLIQYTQKIGQKSEEMRGLAGKPVLMEKNFRITICSRTCCQCWGQKYFNVTAHGHPLDHRLSHFPGSSGNFSCRFPVPRGEALAGLQCSVASSYALQLERAIWPQRRFYADTTANWCYRPQVLP